MIRDYEKWLEDNPSDEWLGASFNRYLAEHPSWTPQYKNRCGSELVRYAKHRGGAVGHLQFVRAINPLKEPQERKPAAQVAALKDAWIKRVTAISSQATFTEKDLLDVELSFMSYFGCRPDEACKLFDASRSQWIQCSTKDFEGMWRKKMARRDEDPAAAQSQHAADKSRRRKPHRIFRLAWQNTKSRQPYTWMLHRDHVDPHLSEAITRIRAATPVTYPPAQYPEAKEYEDWKSRHKAKLRRRMDWHLKRLKIPADGAGAGQWTLKTWR